MTSGRAGTKKNSGADSSSTLGKAASATGGHDRPDIYAPISFFNTVACSRTRNVVLLMYSNERDALAAWSMLTASKKLRDRDGTPELYGKGDYA